MISFSCSCCGMKFKVNTQFAGRSSKCPTCKQPLIVPGPDPTQASVAAGEIEGTSSSLVQAGVDGGVTLDQAPGAGRPGFKPVRELLARRTGGGERYVVEREIARGGMGAILRAVDCDIRREVAVKFLLDQADPRKKARFVEEAQITGQLEHPNIVPVHELGIDSQKRLFFSMKMVRGRSLAQLLHELRLNPKAAEKELSLARLLNILVNVCNALAYAHSSCVVHRDLKPANIMVGDFGEVYVMDWGLAKVLKGDSQPAVKTSAPAVAVPVGGNMAAPQAIPLPVGSGTSSRSSKVETSRDAEADLTQEGAVLGTPVYMPPEQATGHVQSVDPRSDLYSLGAILYEMLALQPPIDKEGGYLAILMRVAQGEIVPPEQRNPQRARAGKVPRELSAIAMKALAKEPSNRYANVEALRRDIERYQEGRSVSAKEDSKREMLVKFVKRNKAFSATAAVALLMLDVALGFRLKNYLAFVKEQREKEARTRRAVPAFLRAGQLAVSEGKFKDALDQATVAVDYDPDNPDAVLFKGQLLIVDRQFPEARTELEKYLKLRPGDRATDKLVKLCQQTRTADPGTCLAFAELFNEQQAYGLADGIMHSFAPNAVEARNKLQDMYRKRIEAAWPGLSSRMTMDLGGKLSLDLSGGQISDLAPLKGMRLSALSLQRCTQLRDLSPLQGMPLTWLNLCDCNQVRDLTPLQGMPLTYLNLAGCSQVRDLAPLKGMPLTRLDMAQLGQVQDLGPLEGMHLAYLNLAGCGQIRDVNVLKGMQLISLDIHSRNIRDLTGLQGMPLTSLSVMNSQVQDLTPLQGMKLTSLSLDGPATNLKPLQGMPLSSLSLRGCGQLNDLKPLQGLPLTALNLAFCNQVRDLTPLKNLKLTGLTLRDCAQVRDLTPLSGMPLRTLNLDGCSGLQDLGMLKGLPLTALDLRNCGQLRTLASLQGLQLTELHLGNCTQVQDVTPLRGMPLTSLDLRSCQVQDLTPLQGMKLNTLMLDGCGQVRDLAPLRGMPLTSVSLLGCNQIRDLTPLRGMELTDISLTPRNFSRNALEVLRQMKSLKSLLIAYDFRLSAEEFWKRYDAGEFTK
jgi:serine/threonine protein kinase